MTTMTGSTAFGGGGGSGGKVTGVKVLPPKVMGAADPQQYQSAVAATNANLRRNLWENVRLFAEEVAEAAVEGKESAPEPEGWAKINDTVNSIQLCLFLLREPYLSPTQVWLGYNQCKTTDRVSFELSAIGREYEHDQKQPQPQQHTKEHDYPDDCVGSPPSASATDKLRRRLTARSGVKRTATEGSAAASTRRCAGGKTGPTTKRARRTASKKSAAATSPAPTGPKRARETAHTVVQEVDSEEERRLDYYSSGLTPPPPAPPAPTGSSSSSSSSSSSEAFNSVGLYEHHLRQTLLQSFPLPPQPPTGFPPLCALPPLPPPAYHAHHDLQQLAPSMVADFPLTQLQPTSAPSTTMTTMPGSGLASLLACAEAEAEAEAETDDDEEDDNGMERRQMKTKTKTRRTKTAQRGGKRRTGTRALSWSSSAMRASPPERSDIYRLLN